MACWAQNAGWLEGPSATQMHTYYSMSEIHLQKLQHRQCDIMYILTGPSYTLRTIKNSNSRILSIYEKSHTPEAAAFIFISQQHPSSFAKLAE